MVCFLDDVYTPLERTLIDAGRRATVRRTRHELPEAMRARFVEAVETATGRRVVAYMSDVHFDPDMAAEVFVLVPEGEDGAADST